MGALLASRAGGTRAPPFEGSGKPCLIYRCQMAAVVCGLVAQEVACWIAAQYGSPCRRFET